MSDKKQEKVDQSIYLNFKQTYEFVRRNCAKKLVPMIHGSPGIGKSALMKMVAKTFNLKLIDIRLAQCDPTDLLGFPVPDYEAGRSRYLPPDMFPLKGDALPVKEGKEAEYKAALEAAKQFQTTNLTKYKQLVDKAHKDFCYSGWLVFLDELPSANLSIQKAAFKILLDRQLGSYDIHPMAFLAAAGNMATDGAIVNELPTPTQSRLVHCKMRSDKTTFLEWADQNLDHRVCSFIRHNPDGCNNFDPDHNDNTFMCERTLEFVSRHIEGMSEVPVDMLPEIAGCIGVGKAREFFAYCKVYAELVTIDEIMADPHNAPVPTNAGQLFALTGVIGNELNDQNISQIAPYIARLNKDLQFICYNRAIHKYPGIKAHQAFRDFSADTAVQFASAA